MPDTRELDPVLAEVRQFVARAFRDGRGEGLAPTTPLVTSGIVDSTGVFEVVEWLERRFGIRIADEEVVVEHFDTLRGLAELVRGKLAALAAG